MDEHFTSTGAHGICMMRATASTQVSIDFGSEEDALNKFRIANGLGPLLAFITDNSPVFEAVPVGSNEATRSGLAVPERMARTVIWDDVDALRSMTAPFTFADEFSFASYAQSLLAAPAIFTTEYDDDGIKHSVFRGATTFADAFKGQALDLEKIEHILSLFFFDTRLKTYVEIRIADSLPLEYALSFVALISGLFYDRQNLDYLAEAFQYLDPAAVAFAKTALRKEGFDAMVYQRPAHEWLDTLIERADAGLSASERPYLEPLAQLVAERRTLID
jgi:glutamate--cysteine ligase